MAEFCYDCIGKVFPTMPPDQNDLRHDRPGELIFDICEGCGAGWFDSKGKKIADEAPKGGTYEPRTPRRE